MDPVVTDNQTTTQRARRRASRAAGPAKSESNGGATAQLDVTPAPTVKGGKGTNGTGGFKGLKPVKPPPRRQPHRALVAWLAFAAALLAVGALAGCVFALLTQHRHADAQQARDQRFVDTATQTVVNMFSYKQDNVDESVNRFFNGMVAGLLAVRARRPALADGLLAFAALTRETAMVAVAALAAVRVAGLVRQQRRPGREDLAWLVPATVFAAWQVVVYAAAGTFPLGADGGRNAGAPFFAAFDAIGYNLGHIDWSTYNAVDRWLAELAVLLLFAVAALCSLRTSAPRRPTSAWPWSCS